MSAEGQFEDAEEVLKQAAELAREHRDIIQSIVKQIRENLQQAEMRAGLPG